MTFHTRARHGGPLRRASPVPYIFTTAMTIEASTKTTMRTIITTQNRGISIPLL